MPWKSVASAEARLNPIPPSQAGARIPAAVETALLRALSTRVEARPPSARELADAVLAAWVDGAVVGPTRQTADLAVTPPPIDALAPEPPTPVVAPAAAPPRRRAWLPLAVTVALLALTGAVGAIAVGGRGCVAAPSPRSVP
jgi:hypothetical protein